MNYKSDPDDPLLYQNSLDTLQGDWFGREMRDIRRKQKREKRKYIRKIKPCIWHDGEQYFSIRELCNRLYWTYIRAWKFAQRHPDLMLREGKHIYCRDVRGKRFPDSFVKDGKEYFRLAELARIRRVSKQTVLDWARSRPHLCLRIGRARYAPNEDWQPLKPPDWVWRDGKQYFHAVELARRRQLVPSTIYIWAIHHPHLTLRIGKHLYARDEEWKSRKADYVPPSSPGPTEEQLKYIMGRTARRKGSGR